MVLGSRFRIARFRIAGKPFKTAERRQLSAIFFVFVLYLAGIAGYRALGHNPPAPQPRQMAVQTASIAPALNPLPFFREFTDIFRKNETITDGLMRHGLTRQQVLDLVESVRPIWPRTRVVAEAEFQGNYYPNGDFHEFRYRVDADRYITIYRDGERFVPLMKNFQRETRVEAVEGIIEESLFLSVSEAGEQPQLAVNLAEIFSGDVDFYTDIQKGDRFRLLVEKKYLGGKLDGYGSISAAELMLGKRRLSAFRFQNQYYDANGKSLRKSLLKSPLKFAARVSSRFSMGRFHPILKIVRPHEGVDYAAPAGTPVAAVASGRVVSAGWNGGFGNSVRISHEKGLETIYSHLSTMEVRSGERVAQGDLIGEVGTTGLSTGPHLDFRLLERGRYRDPAKKIVPDAPPVAAKRMPQFIESRDDLRDRLDRLAEGPKDLARAETSKSIGGSTWK